MWTLRTRSQFSVLSPHHQDRTAILPAGLCRERWGNISAALSTWKSRQSKWKGKSAISDRLEWHLRAVIFTLLSWRLSPYSRCPCTDSACYRHQISRSRAPVRFKHRNVRGCTRTLVQRFLTVSSRLQGRALLSTRAACSCGCNQFRTDTATIRNTSVSAASLRDVRYRPISWRQRTIRATRTPVTYDNLMSRSGTRITVRTIEPSAVRSLRPYLRHTETACCGLRNADMQRRVLH